MSRTNKDSKKEKAERFRVVGDPDFHKDKKRGGQRNVIREANDEIGKEDDDLSDLDA